MTNKKVELKLDQAKLLMEEVKLLNAAEEESGGCPCGILSTSLELDHPDNEIIDFGIKEVTDEKFVNTFNSKWNGRTLTIPVDGYYHINWVFFREGLNASKEDVSVTLYRRRVGATPQDISIASAFAGEEVENWAGRKTGVRTVFIKLKANDFIYLKSSIDGGKHSHIKDIYFNVQYLCCDPNASFPCK